MQYASELDSNSPGIRFPEVARRTVNPAPQLPGRQSKYFYTTPDATINEVPGGVQRSLFAHLQGAESTDEFSYAEANRLGTQSAYLNVPHTVSRTLVPLVLPSAKEALYGNEPFQLPFPHLLKGDIAFYVRLESGGGKNWELLASSSGSSTPLALVCRDWEETLRKRRKHKSTSEGTAGSVMMREASNVFVNLDTANYILHGIQHYGCREPSWRDSFWKGFGLHRLHAVVQADMQALCEHVVRHCMSPFGVVVSEVTHSSDQAVSMVVDGRVERMRNYWAREDEHTGEIIMPEPGDELGFALRRMEVRESGAQAKGTHQADENEMNRWRHVLPGWGYCDAVRTMFPLKRPPSSTLVAGPQERQHWVWQLVPCTRGNTWDGGVDAGDEVFLSLGRFF